MENSDKDTLPLQSLRRTESAGLNTGVSAEPEQEQQDESEPDTPPESIPETPEPKNDPPPLALIEFRTQQLLSRRSVLLKIQDLRKKAEDNNGKTTKETMCVGNDDLCELKAIEKELEELLVKKKELENQGNISSITVNGDQQDSLCTICQLETPHGGIYTLPFPHLNEKDIMITSAAGRPAGPIIPVDSLGLTSVITQCPFCEETVSTEIRTTVSEGMWLLCCLCSMFGCVAGCCLIPFFVDRLKNVNHRCPQCQAHIHTYHPL